jgi:molybdenum cofactor synthesis domain-containing protein
MRMRPFGRLRPPGEAVEALLRAARPVEGVERVPLLDGLGRIAARPLRAAHAVPPFARATWDGYAVAARRTRGAAPAHPRTFRVVGDVFAELGFGRPLRAEETVAIATGGALPAGADAVLPFEEAAVHDGWLTVRRTLAAGERVATVGDDFPRGATLVAAGRPLTPAALGALAASGATTAIVHRRPRVALIPNGNELVPPGARRGRWQIFESNNLLLAGLVLSQGGLPHPFPPLPDRPDAIARALRGAIAAHDLVLITGGSSVGEHDYLPTVFPRLGRLLFHGLAVRPGKPALAAEVRGRLLVGLPGHPTSCLANGMWLLRPLLRRLGHLPGSGTVRVAVRLAEGYAIAPGGLTTVVPLRIADGRAWPTFRDSSAITSLTEANGYLLVPPGAGSLRRGARATAELLLPPLGAPSTA